jgi:tRNA A37 methylthiotransferase MiaB
VVVFRFEERPKTQAIALPDKVPSKIVDDRIKILSKEVKVVL